MKLRIRDNSIRLRLTRTEVDTLRDVGLVGATLNFPGGTMIEYVLESTPASVSLSAQFANNTIRIRLPESTVKEWADSEQVSIGAEQNLDDSGVLVLRRIEKRLGLAYRLAGCLTDDMMTLRTLLEKSSDTDLLREMIGFTAERLMELEVQGLTGAGHGERTPERVNHRNGYRDRVT